VEKREDPEKRKDQERIEERVWNGEKKKSCPKLIKGPGKQDGPKRKKGGSWKEDQEKTEDISS
jgi:hypothetical protein